MLLVAENLRKRYGRTVALDGVSFSAPRGEILGFLGPNGAGKTTTLRILGGYLAPDGGRVSVDGVDVVARPVQARERMGYLSENVSLHEEMRAEEYLVYRARLKGLGRKDAARRVDEVVERCRAADVRRRPIASLSKGYRQRVALADALLGRPPLLLLDEPQSGLDPHQVRELRELLRELARDHTVLLSTPILPEVAMTCRRAVIIHQGRIVAEDDLERLAASGGLEETFLRLTGEPVAAGGAA